MAFNTVVYISQKPDQVRVIILNWCRYFPKPINSTNLLRLPKHICINDVNSVGWHTGKKAQGNKQVNFNGLIEYSSKTSWQLYLAFDLGRSVLKSLDIIWISTSHTSFKQSGRYLTPKKENDKNLNNIKWVSAFWLGETRMRYVPFTDRTFYTRGSVCFF